MLCNEMGHPVLRLTESQWKLRKQDTQQANMSSQNNAKYQMQTCQRKSHVMSK